MANHVTPTRLIFLFTLVTCPLSAYANESGRDPTQASEAVEAQPLDPAETVTEGSTSDEETPPPGHAEQRPGSSPSTPTVDDASDAPKTGVEAAVPPSSASAEPVAVAEQKQAPHPMAAAVGAGIGSIVGGVAGAAVLVPSLFVVFASSSLVFVPVLGVGAASLLLASGAALGATAGLWAAGADLSLWTPALAAAGGAGGAIALGLFGAGLGYALIPGWGAYLIGLPGGAVVGGLVGTVAGAAAAAAASEAWLVPMVE